MTAAEALNMLGSHPDRGLSASQAQEGRALHGANALVEKAVRSRWDIVREQLSGVLTLLLYAAALISALLGDWLEAAVILVIVVLNAVLGTVQEYKAEQSLAALKRLAVPRVRVRRNGGVQEILAVDLVPGDVVMLETGNIVPADGRLIRSANLRVEEAALTGESEPVDKDAGLIFESERALGDRRNMVFSGTLVHYGRGEFVVTSTGMRTELGHIAGMLQGVEEQRTPLQRRLDRMGRVLAYAALMLVVVVVALGLLRGESVEVLLLTAVSLAVAAVPEALTAVVTIALSLGAQRMLHRRALIRRLPAVETLGSVTHICSDKTGTLTLNRMTVCAIDIAEHSFDLLRSTGEPDCGLTPLACLVPPAVRPTFDLLLAAGALASDAALAAEDDEENRFHAVGDPTEGALVIAAAYAGLKKPDLEVAFPRVAEIPFDSQRKRMTTLHRISSDEATLTPGLRAVWEQVRNHQPPPYLSFTKGSVDGMLASCSQVWVEGRVLPLDDHWRGRVLAAHDAMAGKGMRVLAVALRAWERPPAQASPELMERELMLVGMFGMIDPPRPEVRDAVQACRRAGIRPVMITGDHPLTARHIAQQVGIGENGLFLTGQELERMTPEELVEATEDVSIFARVAPEHKLKLIDAYQQRQGIVAMTGDGVNDAPALKKADIGVAMGVTGTDAAKGASDMVLLDDNFASIVAAVEEGRIIFDNIRRFIKYLLTCNVSEIIVMLLGPIIGMPLPLLPLQILWMNLVTDGLPALALGVEPAERDVMRRPPVSAGESIFGRGMGPFVLVFGALLSFVVMGAAWALWHGGDPAWQTVLFNTLVFTQLAVALEARSERESLFAIGVWRNRAMVLALVLTALLQLTVVMLPLGRRIFGTVPIRARHWILCIALSLLVLALIEIYKTAARKFVKS